MTNQSLPVKQLEPSPSLYDILLPEPKPFSTGFFFSNLETISTENVQTEGKRPQKMCLLGECSSVT